MLKVSLFKLLSSKQHLQLTQFHGVWRVIIESFVVLYEFKLPVVSVAGGVDAWVSMSYLRTENRSRIV